MDDNNLLDRIYDASLGQDLWSEVLDGLCQMVGYRAGGLVHVHANPTNPAGVTVLGATGLDSAMTGLMPEFFGNPDDDPYMRYLPYLRPGASISCRTLTDDDVLDRAPIYTGFFKPQDLYHDITTPLGFWQDEAVGMFLSRSRGAGPVDGDDFRRLLPWIPHLQRALRINRELGMRRAGTSALNGLLDRIACGVMLVRPDGKIVAMNESAERIIAVADGLGFSNGELVASSCQVSVALAEAIASAATGKNGGDLIVRRPSSAHAYQIFTLPLSSASTVNWPGAPSAAILISDRGDIVELPARAVAELYGLSPAETTVAIEVARGGGLAAVAARLGLSRNTVKTHLSHVFEKTGTNRQMELARLFLKGPAMLPETPTNSAKLT